jgi:hypothetical protein
VVRDSGADAGVAWQDVVQHVEGELTARGVAACQSDRSSTGAPPSPAFGWLELEATTPERVRIALRFADNAAAPAERALELGPLPADARALSIAVAADELLAANWAGVQERAEHSPSTKAPPSAEAPAPAPVAVPPSVELGPSFELDAFGGGQRLLGADVRLGWRLAAPIVLTLRVGLRQGLPETAPHGSVHGSALLAGLGLRADLLREGALILGLVARADALRLTASAYADAGAVAHEASGLGVVLSVGPALQLRLSRLLSLQVEAAAGGTPRPVHVTDNGERVSGVSGWAASVAGGVSATF